MGTLAFCTAPEVVKHGKLLPTIEDLRTYFGGMQEQGVCLWLGSPGAAVHVHRVIELINSPTSGPIYIVEMTIDGYEDEGPVYWTVSEAEGKLLIEALKGV
jgi:hypothetical protein